MRILITMMITLMAMKMTIDNYGEFEGDNDDLDGDEKYFEKNLDSLACTMCRQCWPSRIRRVQPGMIVKVALMMIRISVGSTLKTAYHDASSDPVYSIIMIKQNHLR